MSPATRRRTSPSNDAGPGDARIRRHRQRWLRFGSCPTAKEIFQMDDNPKLLRRSVLKGVALLAGIALAGRMGASREALAQQKALKTAMKYQDTPSGNRQCSN